MLLSRRRIFLVRHGETDWNLAGRLQGGQDIPLNDLGREQAARAARVVERLSGNPSGLAYVASPLGRTTQTMGILRAQLGLPPDDFRRDDRLKEITFGRWEGFSWPELRRRDPVGMLTRDADPWHFVPPGGENYVMLTSRVMEAVGDIVEDSVVVTHGGVVRAMLHAFAGMPQAEAADLPVRQGAVYLIEDGAFELAVA
ncbi:histidine phosphatase family protein [Bosea sp. 117]|uniref:histidine phosphatase family protein n=1 Tax=Bosea sp. 117 TaxID=1125973 RepID=UPI000AE8338A|nr:histidine phosphatase family protein [Bosea sp. 117]